MLSLSSTLNPTSFNLQWEAIAIDSLQLQFQSSLRMPVTANSLSFIWCPVIIRQTEDRVGYFFLHRNPRIKSFVLITSSSLPLIRLMNFGGGQSASKFKSLMQYSFRWSTIWLNFWYVSIFTSTVSPFSPFTRLK